MFLASLGHYYIFHANKSKYNNKRKGGVDEKANLA